jgi:hypothetical protein
MDIYIYIYLSRAGTTAKAIYEIVQKKRAHVQIWDLLRGNTINASKRSQDAGIAREKLAYDRFECYFLDFFFHGTLAKLIEELL